MKDVRAVLRSLPYFAELSDDLLDEVAAEAREVMVPGGETVIREGDPGESLFVVLDGELEVTKNVDGHPVVLTKVGAGQVQGEMALLEDSPRSATVAAITDSTLLELPAAAFRSLLDDPGFVLDTLKLVLRRLRDTQAMLQQEERMAALGKMAAQLMHELNNPAAALRRSVASLAGTTERLTGLADDLLAHSHRGHAPTGDQPMNAIEQSDREAELADWLKSKGIEEPWQLASPLAAAGWAVADLDELESGMHAEWAALRLLTGELIAEVQLSASRISELVRVVKEYSFLDQGPVQDVDVVAGIEDTLLLLKHKLRGVEVTLDRPSQVPTVVAPGRDLNQVWTNLIDNAADAIDGDGSLTITVTPSGPWLEVGVRNTGEPIPDSVLPKVFDPFFTTKDPGKGTGLGLHTVYSIVNRLGGSIRASSDPEGTTFTVRLPMGHE